QLPAGADKAALAQQLFGRQATALLPLLNQGSEGIAEQMKTMQRYGLTLDESGVKQSLALVRQQRELKGEMEGLKVAVGTALIPVLSDLAAAVLPIVELFSQLLQNFPLLAPLIVTVASAFAGLLVVQSVTSTLTTLIELLPGLSAELEATWIAAL